MKIEESFNISITSDKGKDFWKIIRLKALLKQIYPKIQIEIVSNNVNSFDILEGSFILKNTYRYFSRNTIHLFDIETSTNQNPYIFTYNNDHFFIGPDNGFISLLNLKNPLKIFYFKKQYKTSLENFYNLIKDIISKKDFKLFGNKTENFINYSKIHVRKDKNIIIGKIIYINKNGNLITNITSDYLNKILDNKLNISNLSFLIGGETITNITKHISKIEDGEIFCLINDLGYLEVGIKYGNAKNLLGCEIGSPLIIRLSQDEFSKSKQA